MFEKFNSYKQSKLYKALNNIDLISCLIMGYDIKDSEEILILKSELSDFLKNIIKEYNFMRFLYYINY